MQTIVPLYGFGGGGGTGATLTVNAPAGATVTISKDGVLPQWKPMKVSVSL